MKKKLIRTGILGLLILAFAPFLSAQQPEVRDATFDKGRFKFEAFFSTPAVQDSQVAPTSSPTFRESFVVRSGDLTSDTLIGTKSADGKTMVFDVLLPGVFPGVHTFEILYGSKVIFQELTLVNSPLPGQNQQPLSVSVSPLGGHLGTEMTVTGKNFGTSLNGLYIWFTDPNGSELPQNISSNINPMAVSYLSGIEADGSQEIRFLLPGNGDLQAAMDDAGLGGFFESELGFRVVVNGQPSAGAHPLSIVKDNYQQKVFLVVFLGFLVIAIVLWIVATYTGAKSMNIKLGNLILNPETNKYSLARIQALAWTIVLLISYTYYVVMVWLILDDSTIPDFDPSLLWLMGISTGGMLVARTQDKSSMANTTVVPAEKPNLNDLFNENGKFSLARLQLVGFTVVSIIIYVLYMRSPDLVSNGMPAVPETLLALMGLSQGGYLTGKAVESGIDTQVKANTDTTVDTNTDSSENTDSDTNNN